MKFNLLILIIYFISANALAKPINIDKAINNYFELLIYRSDNHIKSRYEFCRREKHCEFWIIPKKMNRTNINNHIREERVKLENNNEYLSSSIIIDIIDSLTPSMMSRNKNQDFSKILDEYNILYDWAYELILYEKTSFILNKNILTVDSWASRSFHQMNKEYFNNILSGKSIENYELNERGKIVQILAGERIYEQN